MAELVTCFFVGLAGLHGPYWIANRLPDVWWESRWGIHAIMLGIIGLKVAGLVYMALLVKGALT